MATAVARGGCETEENVQNPPGGHIKDCRRCSIRYDWRKSTSGSLKMTYCGSLCEIAATGTTIETLLSARRPDRVPQDASSG